MILAARAGWLDLRAHALVRRGAGLSDDRPRRRPAPPARIGAMLPGVPEPEHVGRVRATLAAADRSSATVDCTGRPP